MKIIGKQIQNKFKDNKKTGGIVTIGSKHSRENHKTIKVKFKQ